MVMVGMMGRCGRPEGGDEVCALCFLHVIITLLKRREAINLSTRG